MASRSGGISGAVYALVVFVFIAVLAAALAILFYTQKTKALAEATEARDELRATVTAAETNSQIYREAADATVGDESVFSVLIGDLKQLKEWEMGAQDAEVEQIKAAREALDLGPADATLNVIETLREELSAAEKKAATLQEQLDKTEDAIASVNRAMERDRAEQEKTIEKLRGTLEEVRAELKADNEKLADRNQALLEELEKVRSEKEAELREKVAEVRARENEIDELQSRLSQLNQRFSEDNVVGPDMTLEPDGEVIDVNLNENVVTINLGSDDRLILGMTFEVFDRESGVQTERNQQGRVIQTRGKATIEVIRFSEDGQTSTARVIRDSFGEMIQPGDLVSNLVFDKDRTFKFYVYGNFDLDGDGRAQASERRRVDRLIREWGGKVIDDEGLPVDTDFLVLGEQVEYPEPLPENPPPPADVIRDWRQQVEAWKQYNQLAGEARDLSIPVLNQNRFLTLIGYYRD